MTYIMRVKFQRRFYLFLVILILLESGESQARTIRIKQGTPLRQQLVFPNTTYRISNVIDLRGESISLPSGSTLMFKRRGVLVNGSVRGHDTRVAGNPTFEKVRLCGSFANKTFKASWCCPRFVSDYVEDVMNLSEETTLIVDKDMVLNNQKRKVNHLSLEGKEKTIYKSDSYVILDGGHISKSCFSWPKY